MLGLNWSMLVKEAPGQQILFKTTHITDTSLNVTVSCCKCFNQEKWLRSPVTLLDYNDVIMSVMASQITSLTIVYSTVYSRRRSKKTSKLRVTGLCVGTSPETGEFPAQRASNAENVSIWWRHHECCVSEGGPGQWVKTLASYWDRQNLFILPQKEGCAFISLTSDNRLPVIGIW